MRRAIFFDRDGVINPIIPRADGRHTSPWHLTEFTLLPRVREAFALVAEAYDCFVVTNQPHVGHEMTPADLDEIHTYLRHEVPGIRAIVSCSVPGSSHYKPNHGMITDVLHTYHLSRVPRTHYMIGDRWKDVACGHAAHLTTIFVGDKYDDGGSRLFPDYHASDIYEACVLIVNQSSHVKP